MADYILIALTLTTASNAIMTYWLFRNIRNGLADAIDGEVKLLDDRLRKRIERHGGQPVEAVGQVTDKAVGYIPGQVMEAGQPLRRG